MLIWSQDVDFKMVMFTSTPTQEQGTTTRVTNVINLLRAVVPFLISVITASFIQHQNTNVLFVTIKCLIKEVIAKRTGATVKTKISLVRGGVNNVPTNQFDFSIFGIL